MTPELQTKESLSSSAIFSELPSGHHARGRPTVLLVGNYGNGNVGDEAILARLVELAADRCEIVVVARNPHRVRQLHGTAATRTLSLASIRALLKADILAIGGGGIFGPGMPLLPKMLPCVALAARLLGKQTAYLAIGAYPGMPMPVKRLLQLSAWSSVLVSVRDDVSFVTLNARILGRPSVPIRVQDPAIDLTPVPRDVAKRVLQASGVAVAPPPLGLSIKATPSPELNERTLSLLASAVDWWCAHRTGAVVVFAFSDRADYGLGRGLSDAVLGERLVQRVEAPERLHVVGPNLHPRMLKSMVGHTAGLIGLRLHAQIFAWATGRPLLGLSFEAKTDAFLHSVGAKWARLSEVRLQTITDWLGRL